MLGSFSFAETVYLNDGNKIEGKIVEQTGRLIRIDIQGLVVTYYQDEIDHVEGASGAVKDIRQEPISVDSISDSSAPASKQLVLRYLDDSGTTNSIDLMFKQMIEQSPADRAVKIREVYDLDEIQEILVPIYVKYFSEDDLRKLIHFYNSPVAKKVQSIGPNLTKDTLEVVTKYIQAKASF